MHLQCDVGDDNDDVGNNKTQRVSWFHLMPLADHTVLFIECFQLIRIGGGFLK